MVVTLDSNTVATVITLLIAISGWVAVRRKQILAEGKHIEEVKNMKVSIEEVKRAAEKSDERVEYLRGCHEENAATTRELKTDMEWVKGALGRIEENVVKIRNGKG